MLTSPAPSRRYWLKVTYRSPGMLVCALYNFAHELSRDEEWSGSNIRDQATQWRFSSGVQALPDDPLDILVHAKFLDGNGIPVRFHVDPDGLLISTENFNARYGEGSAERVIQFLLETGSTSTGHLRSEAPPAELSFLEKLAFDTCGVPALVAGAITTFAEIVPVGPALMLLGASVLGLFTYRRPSLFL